MLIYPQERLSSLQGEDLLAFVTRYSPRPPDTMTGLWALACLAVGMLLVILWSRRRKERLRVHHLFSAMAMGSLVWCGLFCSRVLVPHLFEPPFSSSLESFHHGARSGFDAFLEKSRKSVPEDDGVLLINCGSPHEVEWTQYILYPRRIFVESYSTAAVDDPASFLNPENAELLSRKGVGWVMDLASSGGHRQLIPVRGKGEK